MISKVVVFGSVPLATFVTRHIFEDSTIELLGVVCEEVSPGRFKHHGDDDLPVYFYCKENKIPILTQEEAVKLAEKDEVLGFAVRYPKLIKREVFQAFTPGIINFHGGELPKYRGQNIANQVVLDGDRYAGATLHFIDEGIDTGDIVERMTFPISPKATGQDVFFRIYQGLKECFLNIFYAIKSGKAIESKPQSTFDSGCNELEAYSAKYVISKKSVDVNAVATTDLDVVARAFYFKGHEPACIIQGRNKVYIVPECARNDIS